MLTQHNRKTCRLSTFAIRELGVWSRDETTFSYDTSENFWHRKHAHIVQNSLEKTLVSINVKGSHALN